MLCRIAVAWAILAIAFTGHTIGQVRLERKYPEGATYRSETTTQIEQKLTIAGMDVDTSSDTQAVVRSSIGKRDASGTVRIEEKVESLQVRTKVQGMEYNFDSKNPDNKGTSQLEMLRDVHKALADKTSHVVIGKDNRIQAVEIDKSFLNGLPVEVQNLVKSQIDEQRLKQVANQENDRLPAEPVSPGETWTRTEVVDFGAGQQMTFQTEYTYRGTENKNDKMLDKITFKVLSVMFALQDSPLPLTLKGSDLKASESEGVLWFDRQQGRAVETTSNLRVTGDLQFEANNMELPSKLDLSIKTSSKIGV